MVSAVMKAAPTRNHTWQGHKTGTAIHILHNAGRQTIFKSVLTNLLGMSCHLDLSI